MKTDLRQLTQVVLKPFRKVIQGAAKLRARHRAGMLSYLVLARLIAVRKHVHGTRDNVVLA